MAFGHGVNARFYFDVLDFSNYIENIDPTFIRRLAEIKTLGVAYGQSVAGHMSGTIALAGVYDGAAEGPDEVAWGIFQASAGTPRVFAYVPQIPALDGIAYCGTANVGTDQITAGDDAVRMPVALVASDDVDRAIIVHLLAGETASGEEEDSYDGTSGTTDGLRAYLICTALGAGTALTVTIQDSADDENWATQDTFAALTDEGSEKIENTDNVDQYVRVSWTLVGGTTTATFFVAFARI